MADFIGLDEKKVLCKQMASNLSTLRTKAGMTQDELADRLGFSRQTIGAIENGKREMQWSTFSTLVLFFSKDCVLKQLMWVLGILNTLVEETFNINGGSNS